MLRERTIFGQLYDVQSEYAGMKTGIFALSKYKRFQDLTVCLVIGRMSPIADYRSRYNGVSVDFSLVSLAFMSDAPVTGYNGPNRPQTPHMSSSFSRLISSPASINARSRASTLQTGSIPGKLGPEMTSSWSNENSKEKQEDIFEKSSLVSGAEGTFRDASEIESPQDVPEGFDELPIELVSLIDR